MARSVALLRGINLGKRRVKNPELVAILEDLGFRGVEAYQAAGNLLFEPAPEAERRISEGLEARLGYAVKTFVRTAEEVAAIVAAQPFSEAMVAACTGKLQVTMLDKTPSAEHAAAAEALSTEEDRVVVLGREWFWLPERGLGRTVLDVKAVERLLGVGTTRTRGTLERIGKKLG